jgi:ribulose-phosphate 3-epimerase
VNPGFGGQRFIAASVEKVRRARALLDEARSDSWLQVDGGISQETIAEVWEAGATSFVAGNAIFSARDPAAEIDALRARCRVVV